MVAATQHPWNLPSLLYILIVSIIFCKSNKDSLLVNSASLPFASAVAAISSPHWRISSFEGTGYSCNTCFLESFVARIPCCFFPTLEWYRVSFDVAMDSWRCGKVSAGWTRHTWRTGCWLWNAILGISANSSWLWNGNVTGRYCSGLWLLDKSRCWCVSSRGAGHTWRTCYPFPNAILWRCSWHWQSVTSSQETHSSWESRSIPSNRSIIFWTFSKWPWTHLSFTWGG